MTPIYRQIIRHSWQLSWRHRWLWLLGVFAALLGNGGIYNIPINNITSVQNQGSIITDLNSLFSQGTVGALVETFLEVFRNLNLVSVLILLMILVLGVFILWLAIVTQAGLISGVFRLHKNQETSLRECWQRGLAKFWPVLTLNLTTRVVTYVLLILLGLPFFWLYVATQSLVWQWVLLVISFLIFVPLAAVVSLLVQYAIMYVVLKNSEFKLSLTESWQLFKQNWIVTIELAIVLFIINILAGIGLLIGVVFLALPFGIIGLLGYFANIQALISLAVILAVIALILVGILFGAVLSVFQTTAWVILFTRLTEGEVTPKIMRLVAQWSANRQVKGLTEKI